MAESEYRIAYSVAPLAAFYRDRHHQELIEAGDAALRAREEAE